MGNTRVGASAVSPGARIDGDGLGWSIGSVVPSPAPAGLRRHRRRTLSRSLSRGRYSTLPPALVSSSTSQRERPSTVSTVFDIQALARHLGRLLMGSQQLAKAREVSPLASATSPGARYARASRGLAGSYSAPSARRVSLI